MSRMFAALCVIVLALANTGAQTAGRSSNIEAKQGVDKQWTWTLPETGEADLRQTLDEYCKCRDIVLLYDSKRISGTVNFVSQKGKQLAGDEIDMFVSNFLAEYRLALVDAGQGQYRILPAAEIVTVAPVVDAASVDKIPDWQWACAHYIPQNADPNALRGALQNMLSRQGGSVYPIQRGILICDRADRVREVLKLARALDAELAVEIRAHEVSANLDADKVTQALAMLIGSYRTQPQPTFTRSPGQQRVLVRGTSAVQAEVAEALEAMK